MSERRRSRDPRQEVPAQTKKVATVTVGPMVTTGRETDHHHTTWRLDPDMEARTVGGGVHRALVEQLRADGARLDFTRQLQRTRRHAHACLDSTRDVLAAQVNAGWYGQPRPPLRHLPELAMTRPANDADGSAMEPATIPEGIAHPDRVNELPHGLTAIYISRNEQILIAAGVLPDRARTTS